MNFLYLSSPCLLQRFSLCYSETFQLHLRDGLGGVQGVDQDLLDLLGEDPRTWVGNKVKIEVNILELTFRVTEKWCNLKIYLWILRKFSYWGKQHHNLNFFTSWCSIVFYDWYWSHSKVLYIDQIVKCRVFCNTITKISFKVFLLSLWPWRYDCLIWSSFLYAYLDCQNFLRF